MHELAIADAVVRIACAHAGERRVTKVELKVGRLKQVVPDSLEFAFGLVTEGTVLEGAELEIEDVPARVRCRDCGAEGEVDGFPFGCSSCGSSLVDVVAGEELQVESLELEDNSVVVRR